MGCASSKRIEADVYRPPPTSFAVFDINAIQEPWLADNGEQQKQPEKDPTPVPTPILDGLDAIGDAPRTWEEVSKALEDLKPSLSSPAPPPPPAARTAPATPSEEDNPTPARKLKRKSFSFHTLEELETKLSSKPEPKPKDPTELNLAKSGFKKSQNSLPSKDNPRANLLPPADSCGHKSLKDNPFLVRDKLEREKEGKTPVSFSWDPLSGYPEKCPPGGADLVVIYTTSLGGVRRTHDDCNTVRSIMELHGFVFEERDVSLHAEFRNELKALLGEEEEVPVPRVFVKGRYIGGVEEMVSLNEVGRLRRMLSREGIQRGMGRQGCEGCGGARFVPCLDCWGSCKVVVDGKKERCAECNENGLVYCPICS